MKTKLIPLVSTLAVAFMLARPTAAQTPVYPGVPPIVETQRGGRPTSQREWVRGYHAGHYQGFWAGVHDAREGLPPLGPFIVPRGQVQLNPYQHGLLMGFFDGYRIGFRYPR